MALLRFAAACALAAGLCACTTIGEIHALAPTVTVPDQWSSPPAASAQNLASYWQALGDPQLDRFVELALANNRNLAQAAARVAQARAGVRASRAGYFPQVIGSAGVQRDIGDFANTDPQFSMGADAQWELDLFGRISGGVSASQAELAAAGYGLGDLQRLIVGQVAQTTVSARALATQLSIACDTLRIQDDNLQIARWRLQAGLVSSLDVEQARAQRAQTAASIPAIERDLAQAANSISTLIGEAPGSVRVALYQHVAPIPVPPDEIGFGIPATVLRQRPDVRQAEELLLADTARIGIARAQLLPLVQLTGNIGSASSGLSGLFDVITGGLFAGVSQLIFDGGRARAQLDSARAAAAGSLAAWEQTMLRALADVENSEVELTKARERVAQLAIARDAAENAAVLARSQYQAGLIDFQTLLTAENQLLSARNALSASEAERANAFVSLEEAVGGGWDATATDNPMGAANGESKR